MERPLLAITMGDPAGVGPETIIGAWRDPRMHAFCRAVVVGHPEVLRRAAQLCCSEVVVREVTGAGECESNRETLPCLPLVSAAAAEVPPCAVDPRGGQAAYEALVAAARLALDGVVDGIVTAPLHKAALAAAGHHYPGHTELLAELCGAREVGMMLYLDQGGPIRGPAGLGIVHVTLHTSLRSACTMLSGDGVAAKIRLADDMMRRLACQSPGASRPRIGVCALNPHAGEQGLFGDEESTIIAPAVEQGRAAGIDVAGPFPADTLMVDAAAGSYDGLVAMYHDQGHIALKLLGMHRAVNITVGLPIVRTSVAHGTAFDVAWQGRAQTAGMVEAARVAARLVAAHSSCR